MSDEVLENTFLNGLFPWVKVEVECWEPVGLAHMMRIAQLVENQELTRVDLGLPTILIGKAHSWSTKSNIPIAGKDNGKTPEFPMQAITLRGIEGPAKRLSDAEF